MLTGEMYFDFLGICNDTFQDNSRTVYATGSSNRDYAGNLVDLVSDKVTGEIKQAWDAETDEERIECALQVMPSTRMRLGV